jgi:hypothetical protein
VTVKSQDVGTRSPLSVCVVLKWTVRMHAVVVTRLLQQPQIWISDADYTATTIQTGKGPDTLMHISQAAVRGNDSVLMQYNPAVSLSFPMSRTLVRN